MIRILFINNDSKAHTVLQMAMPKDFHVISHYRGATGVEAAQKEFPDVIILDADLGDSDGIEVLRRLVNLPASPPVIMLSEMARISMAVEAMRQGASDYLIKPFHMKELTSSIKRRVADRSCADPKRPSTNPAFTNFVGECPSILDVKRLLAIYADSNLPVLITGESGTGKDVAARIVHGLSQRSGAAFVPVNCAAIPGELFETEMFGSERGAFTDAVSKSGRFEQADAGTLFLDEIGELPPSFQTKLLRVMEDSVVTRVGGAGARRLDVRFVTATNRPLDKALQNGAFRNDLFYRINTLPVHLPPLRERLEDLSLLSLYILRGSGVALSAPGLEKLYHHKWPGNIRELKNVLERAALFSKNGVIQPSHISFT